MPTHIPAPWRTSSKYPKNIKADSGCDDVVGEATELLGSMYSEEDAAFVVQCVNSHDEMVAVLEHCSHINSFREFNDYLPTIRAAISKATQGAT